MKLVKLIIEEKKFEVLGELNYNGGSRELSIHLGNTSVQNDLIALLEFSPLHTGSNATIEDTDGINVANISSATYSHFIHSLSGNLNIVLKE